jgi:hypothetical protein
MHFLASSVIALLAATSAIAAPTPDYDYSGSEYAASTTTSAVPAATYTTGPYVPATTLTATVGLSNDQTGKNGNAAVPIDGVRRPVAQLYAASFPGSVLVSSTSLNGGIPNLGQQGSCTFFSPAGQAITTLTPEITFKKLGNDPNKLQIVDWTQFTVSCQLY